MADSYPYWPGNFTQDFHAIAGRQVSSGLSMLNVDALIPEFGSMEVSTNGARPSVYKQAPDAQGYKPVYGNVQSELFARLNASLSASPESQVNGAPVRGGNNG